MKLASLEPQATEGMRVGAEISKHARRLVAAAIQPLEPRGRTTMSALLAAQMSYVPTLN